MASAAAKGSHYKARTKKWYEDQGYVVAFMERMMLIHRRDPATGAAMEPLPIKRDQLGADLLAVRADQPVTFVQVKLGRDHIAAAVAEFLKFPFPDTARRLVVVWEKGARQPEVIDAALRTGDRVPPELARSALEARGRRRRAPRTTLF